MASWSDLQTGLTITNHVATDGTDIYYRINTTDIDKYDVSADTISSIATSATWGASHTLAAQGNTNLCWFKGDLYVAITDASGADLVGEIWKYDGSWAKVFELSSGGDDAQILSLQSDDSYLVAGVSIGATGGGRHSTDGSSFSTSTFDASDPLDFGSAVFHGNDHRLGIALTAKDGAAFETWKFNAGNWDQAETGLSNVIFHLVTAKDFFWKDDNGTYKRTTNFSTYTTPSTNAIPARSAGFPYSMAYSQSGSTVGVRQWDPFLGEWASEESIASAGTFAHLIRTDDGETFLVTTSKIIQRGSSVGGYGFRDSQGGLPGSAI